ncbi:MAG: type II toxin-antitoxin system prevent-host-death family antitoxin [Deltaproteobacteria bacterium]|nr:MAG: type II toxin-antitoxin system prevent-host-death family antitoxin [Deltaproteobacteria bacterium]
MKRNWQLQEAKNKLSELINRAIEKGPQVITRRGVEAVVVVSVEEWRKLQMQKEGLVEFFRRSPLAGEDIVLDRSKDLPREVDL